MQPEDRRLFIGGQRSVRRTLVVRALLVLIMYAVVIIAFWLDRGGLEDKFDNEISFVDVVYFSAVTMTTVGYGDIVPVTPRARIIDSVLVTPIRLLAWLIFIGTAYQLVLQRLIEDFRMRRMQSKLENHVIVCGFGHSGACVAHELVVRGMEKRQILIVDVDRDVLQIAAEQGFIGILGNATQEETLQEAMLPSARALFVCTHRDDTNVLVVLTARSLASTVRIIARVEEAENEKLLRQSGADATILPSRIGGILMAGSLETTVLANHVMELISATGRIVLIDREVQTQEIGQMPADLDVLAVAVVRDGRELVTTDPDARLRPQDRLLVIRQATARS
ncbi:potassium channel protein [Povalibacter sp.]|uniref:potassium channel family protein n=1 Tax=Povalibacter sp. TaxID=1962978 RepID=UPI002F3E7A17